MYLVCMRTKKSYKAFCNSLGLSGANGSRTRDLLTASQAL